MPTDYTCGRSIRAVYKRAERSTKLAPGSVVSRQDAMDSDTSLENELDDT